MKGKILKKLNQKMPDIIKMAFNKKIRKRVIKNEAFIKSYCNIKEFEKRDLNQQKKIHFDKTKSMLIYAYENTVYYKEVFDKINFNPYKFNEMDEIKKIPPLTKDIILCNFSKLISKEKIDHYVSYTGGSTGKPLKVLLDTNSIYIEKAFIYSYWSKFGYDFNKSKIVTFRGLEFKNKIFKYNPIDNQIILSPFDLNEKNIFNYVKIIEKYNPDFMHGYPSAIYNFCGLINKSNIKLKINLKSVCFASENIDDEQRGYIEKTLRCTSNIFYGHTERAIFAEYINNSYKFNDLYTHIDLLETEEENVYEILCTGLINKKMPLINYVTDDRVVKENDKVYIYGHWNNEVLIGKNNEKISMSSIRCHNFRDNVFKKIKMYQFEQFEIGKLYFNIVEDEKLNDIDKDEIIKILNIKLKNIFDIELRILEDIELTARGKYKNIKQHIQ